MPLNDWKHDAEQYHEIDQAIMAQIEAKNALEYNRIHGRYPMGLSARAHQYMHDHPELFAND